MEGGAPKKIPLIFTVLLGVMSAAVLLTIYHCIVVACCNPNHPLRRLRRPRRGPDLDEANESVEFSTAGLIPPARVYDEKEGVVSEDRSTCAICLNDFKDGEAVRLLPECLHCFHVPCIDAWLTSHASCPMCRTDTGVVAVAGTLPETRGGGAMALMVGTVLPSISG